MNGTFITKVVVPAYDTFERLLVIQFSQVLQRSSVFFNSFKDFFETFGTFRYFWGRCETFEEVKIVM